MKSIIRGEKDMKKGIFIILLWGLLAALVISVSLSEPILELFDVLFHSLDGKSKEMLFVVYLMVMSFVACNVANNIANLIFEKIFRKNNESKYQTKYTELESGISTPVDLHEVVFRKALFNYYNIKYLGPSNTSSGEDHVKNAVLDAAKGRHLKDEEIDSITNEIMSCLDYSALAPRSNPPLIAEWLDYTYMRLGEIEMDTDFQSLVKNKM